MQILNKVGLVGYSGRFGQVICSMFEQQNIEIVIKVNRTHWIEIEKPQLMINAADADSIDKSISYCHQNKVPLLVTSSGLTEKNVEELHLLSKEVPVLRANNLTLGNFLQNQVVVYLAKLLRKDTTEYGISVTERHTIKKKDKPSSTAIELARKWDQVSNVKTDNISSIRSGIPVSDHYFNVFFQAEELVFEHRVINLSAPAMGLLIASRELIKREKGWLTMEEIYKSFLKID